MHPFTEGNTRSISLFIIKYLESLHININYEVFAHNSLYLRNALVRSNYSNYDNNINSTYKYINYFLYNLLTFKNYVLNNNLLFI